MQLLPECCSVLKYPDFWNDVESPSLLKFLEFRLRQGNLCDQKTEHRRYKEELNTIIEYSSMGKNRVSVGEHSISMLVATVNILTNYPVKCCLAVGKNRVSNEKNSKAINHFWELHQIFQTENMYSEEKAYLRQDQINIEQTQHILNTTRETFSQNLKFQQTVIKQHLFSETNDEDSESIIGQKRNCGSAFPKNKGHESDSDDRERRYRQNSPHKRQCIEPIADAKNNPFFESENNLDKEKAKSKSPSISSPENENTPLVHNNVEDESQHCNDDESYGEVSPNSYDEDHYYTSNFELSEEVKHLDANDALIRNIFLEVRSQFRSRDLESCKTIMDSIFLNGIIDMTDPGVKENVRSKLNEGQKSWLNQVLEKRTWDPTPEFKGYCNQFTEDRCNRVHIPTLVRKSFVAGHFDPFLYEGHDIAQQIMTHFSVRLEAPNNSESNDSDLERTYAIDTTIYVINRLFRMHQDVLERTWLEILTKDTKNRKIDGALKVLKMRKKEHQTICIVEFSYGKKAPENKEISDDVKLARNATRILNKLLDSVPCKKARVYTIQCMDKSIYDIWFDPSPQYIFTKSLCALKSQPPLMTEQFAMDMKMLMDFQSDVLKTVKSVNKPVEIENVDKSVVEITPKKATKKAKKKST
ncbi:13032_t:CDS:10 [Funneliformis geosporum]|nr:13032_t:CDS:10 [Funneliformis geosporum]